MGKFGLSFSWRRAVGLSAAKGRLSRKLGIPLTRSGRQRKVGRATGCLVAPLVFLVTAAALVFPSCGGSKTATAPTVVATTTTTTLQPTTTTSTTTTSTSTTTTTTVPTPSGGIPACTGSRPQAPCGLATGQCNNGQFTCSQTRSGTCSSNGGLRCVYCPGPIC